VTRGPGATRSVGADAPTDIATIRRRLRETADAAQRRRLEDELQQLERSMLDGELERLSHALEQSERRRRVAERTLAAVATDAAGKVLEAQAQRDEAIAQRDALRRQLDGSPASADAGVQRMPRGRAWRALLYVAMLVAILIVIDGVLTIVWEEPVSALFASHNQHVLSSELAKIDAEPQFVNVRKLPRSREYARYIAARKLLNDAPPGHALARLWIPAIHAKYTVIEGTSTNDLTKGPGHYRGTMLPGLPGAFAIAGHRTTFLAPFRNLNKLHHGSRIVISMPYGRFEYRVTSSYTTTPNNVTSIVHRGGHARLVLTACDPPGSAAKRLVVTARPISA
jgi:sortase A